SEATLRIPQVLVRLARALPLPEVFLIDSEDPWEQNGKELLAALLAAAEGDLVGAAASSRRAAGTTFGGADMFEDFEVMWAPAVELQLAAGDLAGAEEVLALAEPLGGARIRPVTLAEVPRLRAMLAAAKGEDAEADFRAAERAHASYGAPYL